jgi:hypothetical protein
MATYSTFSKSGKSYAHSIECRRPSRPEISNVTYMSETSSFLYLRGRMACRNFSSARSLRVKPEPNSAFPVPAYERPFVL